MARKMRLWERLTVNCFVSPSNRNGLPFVRLSNHIINVGFDKIVLMQSII